MNFFPTVSETDEAELSPRQDPAVIQLQAALDNARRALEPAQKAWNDFCARHADESVSIPFSRQKQRLYDTFCDRSLDVDEAQATLTHALEAATAKGTAAWDDIVRQQFADDQSTIAAFIEVLEKHEATLTGAQAAGVRHALNVPMVFMTAGELRTRLAYARTQLGIAE